MVYSTYIMLRERRVDQFIRKKQSVTNSLKAKEKQPT